MVFFLNSNPWAKVEGVESFVYAWDLFQIHMEWTI